MLLSHAGAGDARTKSGAMTANRYLFGESNKLKG
jgi:hypothetical protein